MKVYATPDEVPTPQIDYSAGPKAWRAQEKAHATQLADWLRRNGYTGKHTGRIASFGVADGAAQYMIADGPKSCLIHLEYVDAYQYRDVEYLPKAEVVRRSATIEEMYAPSKLFGETV